MELKCYPQISTGAFETILNKIKFEKECAEYGVQVKAYRTDNGIFSKEDFMEEIKAEGQRITFSGVGAHHMNGVAERSMRTTITKSRTMMLHSMLRWPDQTDVELWPFAMNHATDLNNIIPKVNDGLSPEEKFSRSFQRSDRLMNIPVWGCPACALQPTLQDGKKLSKWKPRSRRAQFVGWSPLHASSVAWVRNLQDFLDRLGVARSRIVRVFATLVNRELHVRASVH